MLNEEVSSQKGRVRDILSAAKKLMRESSGDDLAEVKDKAEELKDVTNSVSSLCSERLAALEQAFPLAEHFFETHADLSQWLDDIEAEAELLGTPAMNAPQIKKQQERNKVVVLLNCLVCFYFTRSILLLLRSLSYLVQMLNFALIAITFVYLNLIKYLKHNYLMFKHISKYLINFLL